MQSLSEDSGPITDINVTPLVDIILVVLIIFMATAPLIQRRALNVDVPAAARQERAEVDALQIVYDGERRLFLAGKPVSRGALADSLGALHRRDPGLRVIVSADRALPYGEIVGVLDLVRGAGVRKASLEVRSK